ncbi:MAG: AmmeMemoRadiSam system protein B [Candidatus Thermoplasmatota archaeon]|jgi:AmmeMemoRadiSam system protein B|nr:AmmeMemoRadiSam system protein B [Candidatus Thermoplasmatota archaeon]MCL5680526.1 AmmeMemoRadiSam system protein B [Candidatus Thermoplasmatota archaeon]
MRRPYVAGTFYPYDPEELKEKIVWSFTHSYGPGYISDVAENSPRMGIISPHAGYDYSGPVAAFSFNALANSGRYDYFIIIGPNHTGLGSPISVGSEDYMTPLGKAKIREDVVTEITDDYIKVDNLAHLREHSVEVQIPFLQYIYGDVDIVPIVMMDQSMEAAERLKSRFSKLKGNYAIIASSDLNHYLPLNKLKQLDGYFSKAILTRDYKAIYRYVYSEEITACGFGPIVTLMLANSGKIELLKLSNSIEINGGSEGVGYASFSIFRK